MPTTLEYERTVFPESSERGQKQSKRRDQGVIPRQIDQFTIRCLPNVLDGQETAKSGEQKTRVVKRGQSTDSVIIHLLCGQRQMHGKVSFSRSSKFVNFHMQFSIFLQVHSRTKN